MARWRRAAGALARALEGRARSLPPVRTRLEAEYERLLAALEPGLKPYRDLGPRFTRLPPEGLPREEVLRAMADLAAREEARWREGLVSGAVYHGDPQHVDFLARAYAIASQANPLHADLWPSVTKYEAEVVAMTAELLGGGGEVCGTITSGGTESIVLAVKAYRDRALAEGRTRSPEIVVPTTAHAAFDKAGEWLRVRVVRVPVGPDLRADVAATERAVTRDTVLLAGSAPSFPHGVVDPIEELAELASRRGIGFHTDACLGGFLLPFARRLGHPVPPFAFEVPGVTSVSADTHKYGYAPKGTSVLLYRDPELRRHQYFVAVDWPGGLYASPTLAGSRAGGLVAACWAAMVATGEGGYLEATRRILKTAATIRRGVDGIRGLRLLGESLFVVAFTAEGLDVYRVMDAMARRGWNLNGLQRPPAVHLCVTLRHTRPGVAERFLGDLRDAVEEVRGGRGDEGGLAPVYGLAARIPFRGVVAELLRRYLDLLSRP